MEFEGELFYVPNDWDAYLNTTYGNYMEMPPEKERKPIYDVYQI
jgi:lipopolysaccharide cholinephosphotransferase